MEKIGKNSDNLSGDSETKKPSTEAPNANKQTGQRTKAERLRRFAKLAMNLTVPESKELEAQDKVDFVLEQMTSEGAMKFLQYVNSQLRQGGGKKSEIYGDTTHRMVVDGRVIGGGKEMVAPEPDLQNELFTEYLDAIKKTKGKEKKAALAYYAINNLHLFNDGNGRTSRAIYSLIKNGDLSDADNAIIEHETDQTAQILAHIDGVEVDSNDGRGTFLDREGIKSAEVVNRLANSFLKHELCDEGTLDERLRDKIIYVYSEREKDGLVSMAMSQKNRAGLSNEESTRLNYAMSDDGGGTTLSGLTLASMLCKKGQAERILAKNLYDDKRLVLRVNFDEDSDAERVTDTKETFAEWQPEDYKDTIATYRDLKKRQNEAIMRFFVDDLEDDGVKISDWICGSKA